MLEEEEVGFSANEWDQPILTGAPDMIIILIGVIMENRPLQSLPLEISKRRSWSLENAVL